MSCLWKRDAHAPVAVVATMAKQIKGDLRAGLQGLEDISKLTFYLLQELFLHRGLV